MLNRVVTYSIIVLFLLGGCGITPKPDGTVKPPVDPVKKAEQLEIEGHYREAAQEYIRLAGQSHQPAQQGYQLLAVENFLRAGLLSEAKAELAQIDFAKSYKLEIPRELAQAWIDLAEKRANEAMQRLARIENPASLPTARRLVYYELHAQALAGIGKVVEAARERVMLDKILQVEQADTMQLEKNRQALWASLNALSENDLKALPQTPGDTLAGWVTLALVAKAVSPRHLKQSIDNWQLRFPDHPAMQSIVKGLIQNAELSKTTKIVLLVPLDGDFKGQATAVRDGFQAAFYHQRDQQPGKFTVDVSVERASVNDILQVYDRVVASGVDFIVGPLEKNALDKLASSRTQLPVPTLGLNYLTIPANTGNLYQFGLSPEDEAEEAAKQAWADGHRSTVVLFPEGDWGQRVANAFQARWISQGGKIVRTKYYGNDLQTTVRQLFTFDESVDMAFVVAFPQHGRLIRAFFRKYYTVRDLPIYSTSSVYSGIPDPKNDRVLEGFKFPDMPWIISPSPAAAQLQVTLQKHYPDMLEAYKRLYALGIDAYQILPELPRLTTQQWQGQSGLLFMDKQGAIHRKLIWAHFVDGIPALLKEQASFIERAIVLLTF